jgi:flagellar assembly factor FliW
VIIPSERFGDLEVDPERVIDFPEGLLGFVDRRRFAMLDANDSGLYFWLQSLDDPTLAFLAVIPWEFFPDYAVDLKDDDEQWLGVSAETDVLVLTLVTVQQDSGELTTNLLGPLVVNVANRRGRQIVLADSGFPVRAPLKAA